MIFTDEVAIESGYHPGVQWTIRRKGEELNMQHLQPTFRQTRKTLTLWGAIAWGKKWPLLRLKHVPDSEERKKKPGVDGQDYVEQVLEGPLAACVAELEAEGRRNVLVLKDSAPIHRSKKAKAARQRLNISNVPHPPNSPDLNPIEPMWHVLKVRLGDYRPVPTTEDKLLWVVQMIWGEISMAMVNSQVERMRDRREELRRKRGKHIHF